MRRSPLGPEAVAVKSPWAIGIRRAIIGQRRGGGRHVVVVAAMFIVDPDQKRSQPVPAVQDSVDDLGGEGLAGVDVLRILLGGLMKVRINDADRRQGAGGGVGRNRSMDRTWPR